jgi:nucleoside-diphosphate-sugar epimerase
MFNFAAVHREPGHERREYFDTNIAGARNACNFAEYSGCLNLLFTSSIAVYGRTSGATTESSGLYPTTAYGMSKLCAELIHEAWLRAGQARRLIICRPGVIYGPGDPGNVLRMIRAVKRGYFVFPGKRSTLKSYGYIEGLLDSFEFLMQGPRTSATYNYVERETEPLDKLIETVQTYLGVRSKSLCLPLPLLRAAAKVIQMWTRGQSPIHPVRVAKAATPSHIVPALLIEAGFPFRFDFRSSLEHWRQHSPQDLS